jgi:hypothetical protein
LTCLTEEEEEDKQASCGESEVRQRKGEERGEGREGEGERIG